VLLAQHIGDVRVIVHDMDTLRLATIREGHPVERLPDRNRIEWLEQVDRRTKPEA
jgi:hypothetical protein